MKKLNVLILLSLLMMLPSLTSCIKEDLDDCKGKVSLHFRYVGDGTTDIFPDYIDKVTLYVYSADDNRLVSTVEYDESQLDAYQGANLELFPGRYHIVCWGNAFADTQIQEGDKVAAPGYFSSSDIVTNDPLYYGSVEIDVPGSLERKDYMCDFVSSHVKIEVRMEGFIGAVVPGIGSEDSNNIALGMAHLPSFTDFGNTPSTTEESVYYPALSVAEDDATTYVTQYNVLRLSDDNPVTLQLLAGTDRIVVQEFSLADFMEKYGIRIDGRNGDVTISILLRASSVDVEIVDWDREEVDPGFDKD